MMDPSPKTSEVALFDATLNQYHLCKMCGVQSDNKGDADGKFGSDNDDCGYIMFYLYMIINIHIPGREQHVLPMFAVHNNIISQ